MAAESTEVLVHDFAEQVVPMAGYSSTPLIRKLGIKPGQRLSVKNPPGHYVDLLGPLPEGVALKKRLATTVDVVHLFVTRQTSLEAELPRARQHIAPDGMIWVSWPKKASKVPTDITENVIRQLAFPLQLVDIKVCAVDEVWSGLKLVIRKAAR